MNRDLIQKKNIALGLLFKGIGMGLNFLLIPLQLTFLGKEEYGIWVTVFSIVNWVFTFDIGIGNGLRNNLTDLLSINDYKKSSAFISTSYIMLLAFSVVIFVIGFGFIYLVNFQDVFNYQDKTNSYLQIFVLISLFFTVINFVLSVYKKLYLAIHQSYVVEQVNSVFLGVYILFIWCWIHFGIDNKSLIALVLIFGVLNVIISLVVTIVFFRLRKRLKISLKLFQKKIAKLLLSLGGKFFVINMSLLIILSTDNIIISNILGPSHVTDYSVIQRIFQFLIVGFSVVLASSWGLYMEAIVKKDYSWISKNLKKMFFLYLGIVFLSVLVFFKIDFILKIWLSENIIIVPKGLVFLNMSYTVIFCFTNIFFFFINATGKIKLQMYLYIIGAIINIPLSIFLVNFLGTSTGVILSTVICTIPLTIAMPIQTKFILRRFKEDKITTG